MLDVFQVFRVFGMLPYKLIKNEPVLCPKWRYYSCILAILSTSLIFYRGIWYLKQPLEKENKNFVYLFLLLCEPMLYVVDNFMIYYTIFNKKSTEKSIKIVKILLKLKTERNGCKKVGQKVICCSLGALLILLIFAYIYFVINQPTLMVSIGSFVDLLISYGATVLFTMQLLQFCVLFEYVLSAYRHLEHLVTRNRNGQEILVEIKNLRDLVKKIENVYYPNIIYLEFNGLFYCILGIRGLYDYVLQNYESFFMASIILFWVWFDLPLQFYLMHLSEVIECKVSVYRKLFKQSKMNFFCRVQPYEPHSTIM